MFILIVEVVIVVIPISYRAVRRSGIWCFQSTLLIFCQVIRLFISFGFFNLFTLFNCAVAKTTLLQWEAFSFFWLVLYCFDHLFCSSAVELLASCTYHSSLKVFLSVRFKAKRLDDPRLDFWRTECGQAVRLICVIRASRIDSLFLKGSCCYSRRHFICIETILWNTTRLLWMWRWPIIFHPSLWTRYVTYFN